MAELSLQERLQPSLLDRLCDDDPDNPKEAPDASVISLERLRELVKRDLGWLLNTCNLASVEDLDDYPEVARSVLNYGLPEIAGSTVSSADVGELERRVKQAILDFEPRLLRHSVHVRALVSEKAMSHNALVFEIEGELWGTPVPLGLVLYSEVDLESGSITVRE